MTPDFDISINEVPVTVKRKPFFKTEGDDHAHAKLKEAGTPRANEAATIESPHGTQEDKWTHTHQHQTVLQQHVSFWDTDNDGEIWPLDTFRGFRRLGYNLLFCIISMFIIHSSFSYPTMAGWAPDPYFRIFTARIHKDKHGSDSGTYDNEGRFVSSRFEDVFSKYASGDKKGITLNELMEYMKGQRVVMDPFGWFGAIFEWGATYLLLWPEDGRMMKEDIRRIYDGSLFFEIAARSKQKQ